MSIEDTQTSWSEKVACLGVDVLVDCGLIQKEDFDRAMEIVAEEIHVRLAIGDYPPVNTTSRLDFCSISPMVPAGPSLADALEFYTKHLGFTIVWQDGVMAGVRRGAIQLNLIENDDAVWANNASFSIGVADLEGLYEEYKTLPANVGPLEMKLWGRREFHMILPSGVCLQFFEETR